MRDVPIPPEPVQDPWEKNVPGLGLGRDPERTPMQWDAAPNAGFTTGEPWLPLADDADARQRRSAARRPRSMLALLPRAARAAPRASPRCPSAATSRSRPRRPARLLRSRRHALPDRAEPRLHPAEPPRAGRLPGRSGVAVDGARSRGGGARRTISRFAGTRESSRRSRRAIGDTLAAHLDCLDGRIASTSLGEVGPPSRRASRSGAYLCGPPSQIIGAYKASVGTERIADVTRVRVAVTDRRSARTIGRLVHPGSVQPLTLRWLRQMLWRGN